MFGDTDPMKEINQHEQESKYGMMRQGERELVTTFKARFDEQILANDAVGVPKITDTLRALDFIGKLDPKRYRRMMTEMRNDALRQKPDAYPKSLAAAFRIASQWRSDGSSAVTPTPPGASAYVTEEVHVTASKDTEKRAGKTGGYKKKQLADIDCYACEGKGHYARNCPIKKSSSEKVHVTKSEADSEDESDRDDWGVALVTASEVCMFSRYDVLLDNEASLNIFSNKELLTNVRRADRSIVVSGIQSGGGVDVDREGDFGEFGTWMQELTLDMTTYKTALHSSRRGASKYIDSAGRQFREARGDFTHVTGEASTQSRLWWQRSSKTYAPLRNGRSRKHDQRGSLWREWDFLR
jgi:DnaJ-domain-containing protein 1